VRLVGFVGGGCGLVVDVRIDSESRRRQRVRHVVVDGVAVAVVRRVDMWTCGGGGGRRRGRKRCSRCWWGHERLCCRAVGRELSSPEQQKNKKAEEEEEEEEEPGGTLKTCRDFPRPK